MQRNMPKNLVSMLTFMKFASHCRYIQFYAVIGRNSTNCLPASKRKEGILMQYSVDGGTLLIFIYPTIILVRFNVA